MTGPPVPGSGGLRLEGVRAGYGDREVLHGIDLEVAAGELLVVLGPSGSGKSTLLRVVAGLEPVTGGRVHLAGRDVTTLRPGRRNVSMVFQTYALFPHLNVLDNITFGLEVRDTKRSAAREAAVRRPGRRAAPTCSTGGPASCRAVSGNASRWPVLWSAVPTRSCWTSRCPTSTPSCGSTPAPS